MTAPRRARIPKSRIALDDKGQPRISHQRQAFPERALLDAEKRIVYIEEEHAA